MRQNGTVSLALRSRTTEQHAIIAVYAVARLVNYVLGGFGIHHVNWEAGRISSWLAISTMVTWRWAGYNWKSEPFRNP